MAKWSLLETGQIRCAVSVDKSGSCTCLWKDKKVSRGACWANETARRPVGAACEGGRVEPSHDLAIPQVRVIGRLACFVQSYRRFAPSKGSHCLDYFGFLREF